VRQDGEKYPVAHWMVVLALPSVDVWHKLGDDS
jgi:hypothetical protein